MIPVTVYIHTSAETPEQAWGKIQEGYDEICSAVNKLFVTEETEFEVDTISQKEMEDNN